MNNDMKANEQEVAGATMGESAILPFRTIFELPFMEAMNATSPQKVPGDSLPLPLKSQIVRNVNAGSGSQEDSSGDVR